MALDYVIDRANVVVAAYRCVEAVALPTVDELLEWVRYIELRCPE